MPASARLRTRHAFDLLRAPHTDTPALGLTLHVSRPAQGQVTCTPEARTEPNAPRFRSNCRPSPPASGGPLPFPQPHPPDDASSTFPRPRQQRLVVAEIACLLCARPVGIMTSDRWPPTGAVVFQAAGSRAVTPLAAWRRMRCPICGGNTEVAELTVRKVRFERPMDWQSDRPRRGRPPKWLVALRRAGGSDAA
jgi:hypothetical protein